MTSEERLEIAEEIIGWTDNFMLPKFLGDMEFCKSLNGGGKVVAYTNCVNCSRRCLGEYPSLIDAVFAARQKLAAEREAAMTPNERKYKAALEEIVRKCGVVSCDRTCRMSANIAHTALKEST